MLVVGNAAMLVRNLHLEILRKGETLMSMYGEKGELRENIFFRNVWMQKKKVQELLSTRKSKQVYVKEN